jgi:hypothetical protein
MKNADEAKRIIGLDEKNDYILDPAIHMDKYDKDAPVFASVLRSSMISTLLDEYKHADGLAIIAKSVFAKWTKVFMNATFITTVFTACLLASASFGAFFGEDSSFSKLLILIFSMGGVAAAAVATGCVQYIKSNKLLEKWMGTRAEAEELRVQYFEDLAVSVPDGDNDIAFLDHLKLEFFRRYQLDVQLSYFSGKSIKHQQIASRLMLISTIALMLVLFFNGVAGVAGVFDSSQMTIIAAFAIIAQAVSTMMLNKEAVNQDRQNAERYEKTRKDLNMLKAKIDLIHKKIDGGDPAILKTFITAVHEPISAEHRQWLASQETRLSAITKLEEELKKSSETRG